MKALLRQLDPLRVLALLLFGLPLAALVVFGMLWLWQTGAFMYWLAALVACAALGYALQQILVRRDRRLLADAATEPDPDWPPSSAAVWAQVAALADSLDPADWPLDEGERLVGLGRKTLETVARAYHPGVSRPLLELTVPHTLMIIERASRDLRKDIVEHVPLSHRLTIGNMFQFQRWKNSAERVFTLYRAGRMVINPIDALVGEAWRHVRDRGLGTAGTELHRWLLRAYVRKVGFYAIDLYSGRLPLDEFAAPLAQTSASRADRARSEDQALQNETEEPLRILVVGRANAGKSSLINALFDDLKSAADVLPDTTREMLPYVLEREGFTHALVFDTPGLDTDLFRRPQLRKAALDADLILWVSPAHRPDRQLERECLDALRALHATRISHRPPALLLVASHIDQLRPLNEWDPPYDLAKPGTSKAANIRDAVAALAVDLDLPVAQVIPACLASGRVYNIDALWTAMLEQHQSALGTRLLRCMNARKRAENWSLLRRQLVGAGRLLLDLPDQFRAR